MRVALVHDWLTGMRGGEKVLLALARLFPEAPLFTLLHVPGSVHEELEARVAGTSFVQRLPSAARLYRYYLPLFPAAVRTLDLSAFDLVLSSSHCAVKAVRVRPGARHLCYCHTPMRYVWDRYDDYFGPARVPAALRPALALMAALLRRWDRRTAARVHAFAANSAYVRERIRRCYGRESEVVPPPVDTEFFTPGLTPDAGSYDLVVSALVPYKRLELALAAYRGSGRELRIVGDGPERRRLESQAPREARFLGSLDDQALREQYRGCRLVLMPGVEDFGIVPVEGMACGRPAIVFGEGGGAESVVDRETGLVFHQASPEALRATIDSFDRMRFNVNTLRARAENFSQRCFEARLRSFVERHAASRAC